MTGCMINLEAGNYFAEPRPCTCKPGCGTVVSQRMPFAGIIPEK